MGNVNRSLTLETNEKEGQASVDVDPILTRAKNRLPQSRGIPNYNLCCRQSLPTSFYSDEIEGCDHAKDVSRATK